MSRSRHAPTLPCVFVLGALAGAPATHAAGVDAGTRIEGSAQASYATSTGTATIESNIVTLAVDEVLDVAVTSLDPGPLTATPGTATLSFEVTNIGNGPEVFSLAADPAVAGNAFDVVVDSLALDTNGNGVYDPGIDQLLARPETTGTLAAGKMVTVFANFAIPAEAADGATSSLRLQAQAATGSGTPGTLYAGKGVDGVDAVVGLGSANASAKGSLIVATAAVGLVKRATVIDPFGGSSALPGATITYTITASVSGTGPVEDLRVTDVVPAGTSYRPGSLALDGVGLTDAADDDAGEVTATAVSVLLGSVPSGTARAVTFDVLIE